MATQTEISSKYGSIARSVTDTSASACCDPAMRCCDPITKDLYGVRRTASGKGSPGFSGMRQSYCADRTEAGETVLDLGSGGGIDVLLSAKRVGPTAKPMGWT